MNTTKTKEPEEIELRPDGWDRFRAAVHAAVKSGPKHRTQTSPAPKRSVIVKHKGKQ